MNEQTILELYIYDHDVRFTKEDQSIYGTLVASGEFITSYWRALYSYGTGDVLVYFNGKVSDIVLTTINRLLERFGTRLKRI